MFTVSKKWVLAMIAGAVAAWAATAILAAQWVPGDGDWRHAKFLNQNGQSTTLAEMLKKPTLLTFVFTDCSVYCPAQAMSVSLLQDELNRSLGADAYQILSVSLTPHFDTPEDMLRFAERYQPDYENWHFLVGTETATEALIAETGIRATRYDPIRRADLDHTTGVFLFDEDGQLAKAATGLPLDEKAVAGFLSQ